MVSVPSVIMIVPPLMILAVTALPLGAKGVPSVVRLSTVGAMTLNFVIEPGPSMFNAVLATGTAIGMSELWSGEAHEQQKHSQNRGCQSRLRQPRIIAELA